ncbi:MAG: SUMF1/EgtB/PvdO family nonheme iron enzyme [Myxococcota bacterium]
MDCNGYRLPTESEWEWMARSGASTAFINATPITSTDCDDSGLETLGWYCGNGEGQTQPTGQLQANGSGLFDVLGNVGEWVWDVYGFYPIDPVTDPLGPEDGPTRVWRGGAWDQHAAQCRLARRHESAPNVRSSRIGLRPVRTLLR